MSVNLAIAGQVKLIPRQVLFSPGASKFFPQVSPNGKQLAYVAPAPTGALNLWVKTIGKEDDRVVTNDPHGVIFYRWQQDSRALLFKKDNQGDENWHIHQVTLTDGKTRDLTPIDGISADFLVLNPLAPKQPKQMVITISGLSGDQKDVYLIDLVSAKMTSLAKNPGNITQWYVDKANNVTAAIRVEPTGGKEVVVAGKDGEWKVIHTLAPDDSGEKIVHYKTKTGKLFAISSSNANTARLVEIDVNTRAIRVVSENPDYDVEQVLTDPASGEIQATQYIGARKHWKVLILELKQDFELLTKMRDADIDIISRDSQDRIWLVESIKDDEATHYYLFDRKTRIATFLFDNGPLLKDYQLAKMKPISFTASDGLKLHGYFTLPVDVQDKKVPLVIYVHGGPWARDYWGLNSFNKLTQLFANRGYAVLQVNFRGSTGFGKHFLNAGNKQWGRKMLTDLIDGKRWAVEQGNIDENKVALVGQSYGGYAVLSGLAFTPDEFTCGVDLVGPSNLLTLRQSIGDNMGELKALFDTHVGNIQSDAEYLKSISPLFKAHQIKSPLMVVQGANDTRVNRSESDQMVTALRKNNITVDYIIYPDEGHYFVNPMNSFDFIQRTEQFLSEHLGGRLEPLIQLPGVSAQVH